MQRAMFNGERLWWKGYGDFAYSIQQTSDGGYIVAGVDLLLSGAGLGMSWIIKLDAKGNVQWQKTYGRKVND